MGYTLADPKPHQEYLDFLEEHPDLKGKPDREIAQLVVLGRVEAGTAGQYILARRIRKMQDAGQLEWPEASETDEQED